MKLESVMPIIEFNLMSDEGLKAYLLINDKKRIKITEKELDKIEKWIKKGDKIDKNTFSGDEKLKKKFIDFITNKTKGGKRNERF